MNFNKLLNFFFIFALILGCQVSFSQYSKNHYIPPVTTQAVFGVSRPCEQYLYISTPSETPISVTIKNIGGTTETNTNVSNNNPWTYYIGTGDDTT